MKKDTPHKAQNSGSYDIWSKLVSTTRFSKRLAWWAVVFAFLAGVAGLLKTVETFAQIASVSSIIFAFLAAFSGLTAKLADKRKQELEEAHKRTPPRMEVAIKTSNDTGQFLVVIEPRNKVPFECQWKIVTRNSIYVSGIPLDWTKVYPDNQTPVFTQRADFDASRVIDDYVELRFDYRSIYAGEFPDANLSGRLVRTYKLTPDRKYCVPTH